MSNIENRLRAFSFLCLALAVSAVASAQSSYTAAVRGVVTDVSGGAVPGATVTVTESDRNVPHTVTTDNAGRYVVAALPPGRYTLRSFRKKTCTTQVTLVPCGRGQLAGISRPVGDIAAAPE